MKSSDFLLIGGDKRQYYCYEMLREQGHTVNTFLVPECSPDSDSPDLLKKYLTGSKYILCPIPFSRDSLTVNTSSTDFQDKLPIDLLLSLVNENHTLIGGMLPQSVTEILTQNNITWFDLMKSQSLTYANAYLTAEGLIKDIIETTPFSITGSHILVLGYGNCGSAIAKSLRALGGHVTVYNRNKYYDCKAKSIGFKTLCRLPYGDYLSEYDIIINTIPDIIYKKEHLEFTKKSAHIFEVASAPGGFETDYIKEMKLSYKNCPGIPGKTSPMTAAQIICNVINEEFG